MTGYALTRGNGRVASGEYDQMWLPRLSRGSSRYGVVLVHGAGTPSSFSGQNSWPDLCRLGSALANAGIPCIAPCDSIDHWANSTHMSHITAAGTTLAAAAGCSSTKWNILGCSMGGGGVLRYAALNPSKVASVNAMIPAVAYTSLYWGTTPNGQSNVFTSQIAAAWGLTSRAITISLTNGSNTFTVTSGTLTSADAGGSLVLAAYNAAYRIGYTAATTGTLLTADGTASNSTATLTGVAGTLYQPPSTLTGTNGFDYLNQYDATIKTNGTPGRLFYASDDPYIRPSDVTAAATATGWTATNLGTGGHANPTAANWRVANSGTEFSDLIANLIANGS